MNGGLKQFQIGGDEGDVVVESHAIANGAKHVYHAVVAKRIGQSVQPIDEEDRTLVAPLKGIDHSVKGGLVLKHLIPSMRGKQGIGLRGRQTVGGVGLCMWEPEQTEQWHAALGQLNTQRNHRVRVGRIQKVDMAWFKLWC